jgi:hypothetical protein
VAHIQRFYKQGDYRLQPSELPGIDPQEGKKPHGTRKAAHGTDGNAEAVRRLVEAARRKDDISNGGAEDGGDMRDADGAGGGPGEGRIEGVEGIRGGAVGV